MTTDTYSVRPGLTYKFKLSLLLAFVFVGISRLVLHGSGLENQLDKYLIPLLAGSSTGYLLGYLFDTWQNNLLVSRNTNIKLQNQIQEKRVREAWYTALFEKNHSILLLINATTGLIEEANPSACDFYGYSLEQLRQMHISEINSLPREEVKQQAARLKKSGEYKNIFKHRLASGEEKDVEVLSGSIAIDGKSYLFSVIKDISDLETLQGIIPICSHCKQIRDNQGEWNQLEEYLQRHSEASFSHGVCPGCAEDHYPSIYNK